MYYDRLMNSINLFLMTTLVFMKHTSEDVSLSLSFFFFKHLRPKYFKDCTCTFFIQGI